ncbi:MAG TPA: prepilin-type N-terminal cleavage/methylation domain-containing protein [Verrucomicrobiae bacterium]
MRLLSKSDRSAFSLVELVIATAIGALTVGGSMYAYVFSARRAEWSAYSLAAHSLAMQRIEQARAAKWDPKGFPPVDELVSTNFNARVDVLDIPISGTNISYATSITSIASVSLNPPLKKIRVDCTWSFVSGRSFTNTVVAYRAPDQ